MDRKHTAIEKIDVTDYGMNPSERITAGTVKLYFIEQPEDTKQALERVVRNQIYILNLRTPGDRPILLKTDIDGAELGKLIDTAKTYTANTIAGRGADAEDPTIGLLVAQKVSQIDGKAVAAFVSIEFLEFLTDCCAAMFG